MDMSNKPVQEHFLDRVNLQIEWAALAPQMQALSSGMGAGLPLAAVKMLLLSHWYKLGDVALTEACQDRRSFRRFLGLESDAADADVIMAYRLLCEHTSEAHGLIDAVDAQLKARGLAVKPGERGEVMLVEVTSDEPKEAASATMMFEPGEMDRMLKQSEPLLARAGAQVHSRPPTAFASGKPPERAAQKQVCATIEWPWGETTDVTEHLNIGRQFGFCPFAREMQQYGHVSRKHAELLVYGDGIWLRDLGSSNGTYVNDEEVPKGQAYLIDADARLRFGPNFVILLKLKP